MKALETRIVPVCFPFQFSHAACARDGAQPMLQLAFFFFFPQESIENTHLLDAALALLEKKSIYKEKRSLTIMASWSNHA